MRAGLFTLLALLLGISLARADPSCVTVTDFAYAKLNMDRSSQLHLSTFLLKADSHGLVIPAGKKANFEFHGDGVIKSIEAEGGAFRVTGYSKVGSSKQAFDTPVAKGTTFGSDVTVTSFTIAAASSEVTIKSLQYCSSGAASARKRSIEVVARDVVDETVHTKAVSPVIPVPYCNHKIESSNGHSYCFSAFGYQSANNHTLSIPENKTRFVGADNVPMLPELWYPGGDDDAITVVWMCDAHITPAIKLIIDTPMVNTTSVSEERYTATITRNYRVKCPDDLIEWLDETDVPSLFVEEDDA